MPVVSPAALRAQIAQGALQPVYLLVGDDDRLLNALATAIADTVEDELRAFNCERLYVTDKDVTPESIVDAARIAPMISPRRIITVLRAEKWLKPKRVAADAADDAEAPANAEGERVERGALGPIVDYIKSPVASSVVVFVASDVHKAAAPVRALYKSATVVECWGLGDREDARGGDLRQAVALIKQGAAASGRQIDPAAAQLLAERSGGDIGRLRADLDHVLLFAAGARAITRADVDAVVGDRERVQDHWAMVNAIERGQTGEALRQLAATLDDGAAPHLVLGQLAWFVREKLPRLRPQGVPAAVQALFRTDLDLKTSGGEPRVLLERLVLELCGRRK